MKNETQEERATRKAVWMEKALANSGMVEDQEALKKEAEKMFEDYNK